MTTHNNNILATALNNLLSSHNTINDNPHDETTIINHCSARAIVSNIMDDRFNTSSWLSKQKWFDNQENPAPIISKILHSKTRQPIDAIKLDNNYISDNPTEILNHFADFYKNIIFKQTTTDTNAQNHFLSFIHNSIHGDIFTSLDRPFIASELNSVKRKLPRNKVPGADRIPYEFYLLTWPYVLPILIKLSNNIGKDLSVPPSMNHAIITVKYKNKGVQNDVANYRPISLTNCDYKIIAKAYALRTSRVLDSLIHHDQTGFIPGRNISLNIFTFKLLIELAHITNTPFSAFLCDFTKAYDSADRSFIAEVMNKMNSPPFIINAFKALHAHTTAQVMINGKLSNEFNVYSGVRQGCPWAPLLFIILMEPFAEAIRSNTDIHGIDIPKYSIPPQTNTDSVSVKFSGYADDSTIFTSDISSMLRLNNIFHLFHQASGEKLNLNKCIIMLIGDFPNNHIQHLKDCYPNTPIKTQHHCTIYLGSPIGNDSDPSFWNSILTKFQNKISLLKLLNLSTLGRARTAQSYALSCIWYALGHSNLPSSHDYI